MAKYVREQKYMQAGMKNRKSPNKGLAEAVVAECWMNHIVQ